VQEACVRHSSAGSACVRPPEMKSLQPASAKFAEVPIRRESSNDAALSGIVRFSPRNFLQSGRQPRRPIPYAQQLPS